MKCREVWNSAISMIIKLVNKLKKRTAVKIGKEEWGTIIKKFDISEVGICIDCRDQRYDKDHYTNNISRVVDLSKVIVDATNYPNYLIIYIHDFCDTDIINNTYKKVYKLYNKATYLSVIFNRFHKHKTSTLINELDWPYYKLPIQYNDFDIIEIIHFPVRDNPEGDMENAIMTYDVGKILQLKIEGHKISGELLKKLKLDIHQAFIIDRFLHDQLL